MANILNYLTSTTNTYATAYDRFYPAQYFSGVDCSFFMNMGPGQEPLLIDEICDLQFTMRESTMPVFGYASYTANEIVHGVRLIEGSFCVNLRPGDYLHELVNNLPPSSANASLPVNLVSRPDPNIDPDGYETWSAQQIQQYWGVVSALQASSTPTPLSSVPYFTQNDFTILLVYGSVDSTDLSRNTGRIRTIEGVSLTGISQHTDMSGVNIQEVFTFRAKDMNSNNRSNTNINEYNG